MRVAMYYNNRDVRIEEKETPIPKNKEILVKVHSSGICGSDLAEWYRMPRAPLVQGHEMSGEIVEVGPGIEKFKIGDRVFVAPKVGCQNCKTCSDGHESICPNVKARMPGAFAEFVCIPEELQKAVFSLPHDISYETATFIEPLACAIRAQKLAGVNEKDEILVIGSGISGLLHTKLAKNKGADVTAIDINEKKLEYARKFGANTIQPTLQESVNSSDKKFSVVILCTAALKAFETAWKSVGLGGRIILFTVPAPDKEVVVPVNDFWRKEVKIITSYYCGPDDLQKSMEYIFLKKLKVDDMITHRLPLSDIQKGFQLMADGSESLKIIIEPQR
ncbi:alcohol dehydrogenase catalytic domain-containing protein [Candidatus Aenigmatarchaeota archaeon]